MYSLNLDTQLSLPTPPESKREMLEKAVEMLLEELKRNPPKPIVVPTPPRKKR